MTTQTETARAAPGDIEALLAANPDVAEKMTRLDEAGEDAWTAAEAARARAQKAKTDGERRDRPRRAGRVRRNGPRICAQASLNKSDFVRS